MSEDIQKHVRAYIVVFAALMVLTVVTVAISRLHLPLHVAVLLALAVASVKATLVGCYFMHLISERKAIYALLILTGIFFAGLLFLPVLEHMDHISRLL